MLSIFKKNPRDEVLNKLSDVEKKLNDQGYTIIDKASSQDINALVAYKEYLWDNGVRATVLTYHIKGEKFSLLEVYKHDGEHELIYLPLVKKNKPGIVFFYALYDVDTSQEINKIVDHFEYGKKSAKESTESPAYDYCLETLNFHLNINREFNKVLFEQMERESAFIIGCMESMEIVLEEVQGTEAKRGIFQKIIGFLKYIYKLFTDKTQAMIERNKEWLDANASKLDSIDYKGLQIEMIPFWTMGMGKIQSDSQRIQTKILTTLRNSRQVAKYKDMETVKKELFGEYLDENGDLTNGLKNYMRVGNAKGPLKPVILRDNQLKEMVTKEFRKYCSDYGTVVLPFVRKLLDEAQRQLTMIEKTLAARQQATKESFCLIENAFYSDTDAGYFMNEIVLEAEQTTQNNQTTQATTSANNKKVSPTKVQVTDTSQKNTNADQDALNRLSSDQLIFFKNVAQISQISATSLMTALEERYTAYMAAMKQIVSARGKTTESGDTTTQKPSIKDRIKNKIQKEKQ